MKANGAAAAGGKIDAGTFDFIVTGAGSAGCCVAARLSENGRYRVLLLEAGGEDRYWWIHVPVGYSRLFANPSVNWMFESEPEPELEGRSMYQPRCAGRHQLDQRHGLCAATWLITIWRQRGCGGWDWDSDAISRKPGPGARPERNTVRRPLRVRTSRSAGVADACRCRRGRCRATTT
jgi:glycine/D-amino acid oxidase-like deaminating enzyme